MSITCFGITNSRWFAYIVIAHSKTTWSGLHNRHFSKYSFTQTHFVRASTARMFKIRCGSPFYTLWCFLRSSVSAISSTELNSIEYRNKSTRIRYVQHNHHMNQMPRISFSRAFEAKFCSIESVEFWANGVSQIAAWDILPTNPRIEFKISTANWKPTLSRERQMHDTFNWIQVAKKFRNYVFFLVISFRYFALAVPVKHVSTKQMSKKHTDDSTNQLHVC